MLFSKLFLFIFLPVPIDATTSDAARFPIKSVKSNGIPAAKHNDVIASNVSPAPILSTTREAKAGQLTILFSTIEVEPLFPCVIIKKLG